MLLQSDCAGPKFLSLNQSAAPPWRRQQRSLNDVVEVSVPRSPSGKLLFDAVHSRRKLVKPLIGLLCGRRG